jgi:hypothetical protein
LQASFQLTLDQKGVSLAGSRNGKFLPPHGLPYR